MDNGYGTVFVDKLIQIPSTKKGNNMLFFTAQYIWSTAHCKQHLTKTAASNSQAVYVICCLLYNIIIGMQRDHGELNTAMNCFQ